MKKPKPDMTPPLDEFASEGRPAPEPVDDEVTLDKLDKLPDAGLDEAEPPAAVLDRVPEARRGEAAKALQARCKRVRQYVSGASDEVDW